MEDHRFLNMMQKCPGGRLIFSISSASTHIRKFSRISLKNYPSFLVPNLKFDRCLPKCREISEHRSKLVKVQILSNKWNMFFQGYPRKFPDVSWNRENWHQKTAAQTFLFTLHPHFYLKQPPKNYFELNWIYCIVPNKHSWAKRSF